MVAESFDRLSLRNSTGADEKVNHREHAEGTGGWQSVTVMLFLLF